MSRIPPFRCPSSTRRDRLARHLILPFAVVATALFGAGCGSSVSSTPVPSPSVSSPGATQLASVSTPTSAASAQSSPPPSPAVRQTMTDWGTIWDALPPGFPEYPGAEPTDTGEGAASATLAIRTDAKTASNWWATALTRAGFSTQSTEGPLENGSIIVHSLGQSPSCRVQATFVPQGATTIESVLFAAACPFV